MKIASTVGLSLILLGLACFAPLTIYGDGKHTELAWLGVFLIIAGVVVWVFLAILAYFAREK